MRTLLPQLRRRAVVLSALLLFAASAQAAEPDFVPSAELLAAAKREGKIVLYTANFLDTEQAVAKRFGERFPGIGIEIVRAPTGQLITRIKTEAAANRMIADVIDISDRVQARGMLELFQPYAPPNAADFPELARTADRLWPRSGNAWTITYNAALVTNPPQTWADLIKPEFGKLRPATWAVDVTERCRSIEARLVTGTSNWTMAGMPTPTVSPRSGAMLG